MALKGKIYSLAKQREDIDSRNVFESMIKRSAGQNSIFLDGRNLAAGSIFAEQISVGAIEADHIESGAIETDHMLAGTIDVSVLNGSQLILPGENYGGVVIDNKGISMKSTGIDIKLSSASGFNITDRFNNQLIDIDPSTGNVKMQVNQMTIGGHSAATTKDIDDIEVGGRNLIVIHTSIPDTYIDPNTGLPTSSTAGARSTDWIKVSPSTDYTFNIPSSSGQYFYIGYFNNSKTFIKRDRFTGVSKKVITTTSNTYYLRVSHPNLENAKLEKGTKATDWTPAPEDVQAEIDSRPTFQDFGQTNKVTINGGNIKAGTISSKNNYSWIDLDDGSFSFGDGRLVWDSSESTMTVDGKISVSNIDGDIPKDKLEGSLQTEINAGSAAKTKTDAWSWNGTTEIDGTSIRAQTITTDQIKANSITSTEINVAELSSITSNIGTVEAGLIKSEDESIIIDLNDGVITLGKPLKIQGKTVATEDDISSLSYGDIIFKSGQKIFTDQAEDSAVHVEVDGKSYQYAGSGENLPPEPSPDYPVEIHSLNDFDVVSSVVGRNFFRPDLVSDISYYSLDLYVASTGNGLPLGFHMPVKSGETYTVSRSNNNNNRFRINFTEEEPNKESQVGTFGTINGGDNLAINSIKVPNNAKFMHLQLQSSASAIPLEDLPNIKIEKGDIATEWTPAPEDITPDTNHPLIDKINLSLSEPLRSVGDVKDRVFRGSDGLWKVERNVRSVMFNENTSLSRTAKGAVNVLYWIKVDNKIYASEYISTHYKWTEGTWHNVEEINVMTENSNPSSPLIGVFVDPIEFPSTASYKNWLKDNPVEFQYQLTNPIIETLSQELQDQLNTLKSFKGSNYIYTVNNTEDLPDQIKENLIPTLHATFKGGGWLPKYNAEQARIDLKSETNNIRNDMDNLVTLEQYNFNKEDTDEKLDDYQAAIDVARRELNGLVNEDGELILGEDGEPIQKGVVNEVLDLLSRTALVEIDYEEHSKKLKFMETDVVMGAEGMFIGDTETRTGIMISPRVEETDEHEARASRIDFLDNNQVVAYISSYMMEISRGIFVQSAQIGEHKIETIGDGHTTFQWIPK